MEEIEQYEKHMNLNLLRKLWFDDLGHVWQLFLLSIFCSSKKKGKYVWQFKNRK